MTSTANLNELVNRLKEALKTEDDTMERSIAVILLGCVLDEYIAQAASAMPSLATNP
jgi:hypothetical protein